MHHDSKPHSSLEIEHDRGTLVHSLDNVPKREHENIMAPSGNILDSDTQVYYAKKYRQLWASGPASMVSVLAGVGTSICAMLKLC